jgi:hypothetical protein
MLWRSHSNVIRQRLSGFTMRNSRSKVPFTIGQMTARRTPSPLPATHACAGEPRDRKRSVGSASTSSSMSRRWRAPHCRIGVAIGVANGATGELRFETLGRHCLCGIGGRPEPVHMLKRHAVSPAVHLVDHRSRSQRSAPVRRSRMLHRPQQSGEFFPCKSI